MFARSFKRRFSDKCGIDKIKKDLDLAKMT